MMTREQIETAIAKISDQLKGPIPHFKRQLLAADRRDLRDALAALGGTGSKPLAAALTDIEDRR